jgi:hypothetical protein
MLIADYERALKKKLQEIPLQTRQQWNETNLLSWFEEVTRNDSYLRCERCPGSPWQRAKNICKGYFGSDAIW